MVKYYKDFCGATASITVHRYGHATLRITAGNQKRKTEHKNEKAAYSAWRRWCN